jgi:hypothetical protein
VRSEMPEVGCKQTTMRGGMMMDDYSRSRGDGVAGDLAFLLFLYLAVVSGFAFGLYGLLQPTRFTNAGLAAYKPPTAASVIPPRESNLLSPLSADFSESLVISATPATEPDTDGRSMPKPPIAESVVPARRPPKNTKSVKAFSRQITREAPVNQQRVATCLPKYDSSGAQTQAC